MADDEEEAGVPEWVVTYGDMMSLLLTFFIMLVSLSEVVADQKYRAILEAARKHLGYAAAPPAPPGKNFPMNSLLDSLHQQKLGSQADTEKGKGGVKQKAPRGEDIRVLRLDEGQGQLAGPVIEFAAGSARIDDEMRQRIRRIAREVAGKPQKLEVRTFNSPLVQGIPQSPVQLLDLGFQRAEAVRQILLEEHIERKNVRLAVYFATHDEQSDQKQSLHRDRVEITIYNQFASEYIGTEESYR